MANSRFRDITVQSTERLTPNMQRIVFTGESLLDFPGNSNSGYVKLLFHPNTHAAIASQSDLEALGDQRPVLRTYTVRHFDSATLTLVVDFALHGSGHAGGPASDWAQQCQPGDHILIGGPGPVKLINNEADWLLFAGDMTALPAISANLESLPEHAKGVAVIEAMDASDHQELKKPKGVDIIWVSRGVSLVDAVKEQSWQHENTSVWAAAEFSTMRALRQYFVQERSVPKDRIYISSYWKQGNTEEQHKIAKRQDAESLAG